MRLRSTKRKKDPLGTLGAVLGVALLLLAVVFNQYLAVFFDGFISYVSGQRSSAYEALPKKVLAARLVDAEEELARVRYQGLLYAFALERMQEIQTDLGLPQSEVAYRGRVFSRPPHTHYDTLLVEVIAEAPVAVGDYAYASGVLIGDVVERRGNTVLVSLFSAPGRVLDVRVGEPNAIVVVHGLGGGAFLFDVSKDIALSAGGTVSSAHGDAFVATIQNIIDEPERTDYRVYAASPIALSDMYIVEFTKALETFEIELPEESS